MKNSYPIVYAIMPIYEPIGWTKGLNRLERYYGEISYIVSKCYLIKEEKVYSSDGIEDQRYEVVFPYEYDGYDNKWKRVEPEYNFFHGGCTNSKFVYELFDSFEKAKILAKEKNQVLIKRLINRDLVSLNVDSQFEENYKRIVKEHNDSVSKYEDLELAIEEGTDDMQVGIKPKKQEIVLKDSKIKNIDISLYKAMEFWSDDDYIAYTLTEDEYNDLLTAIKNKENLTRFNKNILLVNRSNQDIVRISDDNHQCYLINGILDLTKKIDDVSFDKVNATVTFYTTETYSDVITSFAITSKEKEISNNDKVIKRVLDFNK